MTDRRDQSTSHSARVSGLSLRDRAAIAGSMILIGTLIVLVAISRDDVPVGRVDPSGEASPSRRASPPPSAAAPSPPPLPIDSYVAEAWAVTASNLEGPTGSVVAVECPAGGTYRPIRGVRLYTDDSSICTAASHMGYIDRHGGGIVMVALAPGQSSYTGHELNFLRSQSAGPRQRSFRIRGRARVEDEAAWRATAQFLRGANGERIEHACPAGVMAVPIWGEDVYTDDSAICTAAVHAGLITRGEGGTVTIEIRPGQNAYTGSRRNGIQSDPWDAWDGSFVFVDP
jgi:hypothetical protein